MNKKLLFFVCSIISLCYAAEKSKVPIKVPIKVGRNAFDWFSVQNARNAHPLEDCSIAWNIPHKGYMLGVFDGHSGGEVAGYVEEIYTSSWMNIWTKRLLYSSHLRKLFSTLRNMLLRSFTVVQPLRLFISVRVLRISFILVIHA